MKKATVKKDFPFCAIIELVITTIVAVSLLLILFNPPGDIKPYPEETYKMLEEEVNNLLVDDKYIDTEKLSDKNIQDDIEYYLLDSDSDSNWKIKLRKGNISVCATIIKSPDDTLLVEKIERNLTEDEHKRFMTKERKLCFFVFSFLTIFYILGVIFFSVRLISKLKKYLQFQKSK